MKKQIKTSNKELFYSLCKEYNLSIKLETYGVIQAIISSKYLNGSCILEYNICKDSLYMPANIDRDNKHIYLYSIAHYTPLLFKIMCKKFLKLEQELKKIENQQHINSINNDFI